MTQVSSRRSLTRAGKAAVAALVVSVLLLPAGIVVWPIAGVLAHRERRRGLLVLAVVGTSVGLASLLFVTTGFTSHTTMTTPVRVG